MPELQEKEYDSCTSAANSSNDGGQADSHPSPVSSPAKTKKQPAKRQTVLLHKKTATSTSKSKSTATATATATGVQKQHLLLASNKPKNINHYLINKSLQSCYFSIGVMIIIQNVISK